MKCFMPYFALIIMDYHVKIICYQPHVPTPQVDTQVILLLVVLPTPPAFAPCLLITTQLTRPTYGVLPVCVQALPGSAQRA